MKETWHQLQQPFLTYSVVTLITTQHPLNHIHIFRIIQLLHYTEQETTDNSAPWLHPWVLQHGGNKSSIILLRYEHRFGGDRASSQPSDTHDYLLGSLITGQTEGIQGQYYGQTPQRQRQLGWVYVHLIFHAFLDAHTFFSPLFLSRRGCKQCSQLHVYFSPHHEGLVVVSTEMSPVAISFYIISLVMRNTHYFTFLTAVNQA